MAMGRTNVDAVIAAVSEDAVSRVAMTPARHPWDPNAPSMTISSRVMNVKHMVMVQTNAVVAIVGVTGVVVGLVGTTRAILQMARSAVDPHRQLPRRHRLRGMAAAHGQNQTKFRSVVPQLHIARQMLTIANSVVATGCTQWQQKP